MRRRPARSRILKKSPRAPGGDRARSRRRRRSPRGLVRRRGPHRPEEQDHPAMGQTGLAAERPERPANRLSLHLRGDLPEGRQGRGARHAPLRHRGDEPASGRNRHADRARRPRRAAHRSGRLASLRPPRRPAQHHAHLAARKVPRTEPAGKRMAVHARQLAVEPSLQILRRHRQPLLRRLEQARRSALENHLHRNARLGVWVLISESWYCGVYDVTANAGFVSVGITSDTAEFAVGSIRCWLERMGRQRYPQARELTITADCGGSNGARVRLWKLELQKLADETGLAIHVHHYPPGASKWNKIEHRLFCHITQNWRGRPLTDRLAVVELISATTTNAGLKVESALDTRRYQKGIKVSNAAMKRLDITGDQFHPEWNYTIKPRPP